MGVQPATLEVAPNRDLFVPFEFPVAELVSGWYGVECQVAIDGSPETVRPEARFVVPWPRGATRRDQVLVGKSVPVGGEKVRLDQLECRVRFPGPSVRGDGGRHHDHRRRRSRPVLETTFDAETGSGSVTAYPVLKTHRVLTIAIKGAGRPIEVPLP